MSRHQLHGLPVSTGCSWCRDIILLVATLLAFQHLHSPFPVMASRQFTCRDKVMHVATSFSYLQVNLQLLIIMIPVATYCSFSLISLMLRPQNWTVYSSTAPMTHPVASISALSIDCTFIPLIFAFFYCFFFFLPFYLLVTNW